MAGTPNGKSLQDLLASAQLPALPQSAIKLLELAQDPNHGPAEFATPIEADPGLTGQVLRFVNSSYFGFSREISSVKLAITLVGVRTIKNFALWSAVFSLMPNPKCGPFDLKSLWQDSLRRGLFARLFGKSTGLKDAEDLFAASLLQDMAVPLLAKELPQNYTKLLQGRQGGAIRLSGLELEEFGWNHAQAAGIMARSWSLPEEFARLIENHTSIETAIADGGKDRGVSSVSLSSMLPACSDQEWPERETFRDSFGKLCAGAAVTPEQLLAQVDADYSNIAPLLKLGIPKVSLADALAGQTAPAQ